MVAASTVPSRGPSRSTHLSVLPAMRMISEAKAHISVEEMVLLRKTRIAAAVVVDATGSPAVDSDHGKTIHWAMGRLSTGLNPPDQGLSPVDSPQASSL